MPGTSPTVRQRELAARLRQLRHDRGLTVDDVAKELLCSSTKISRIETAARRPSLRDVRDLCRVYGIADKPDAADLMVLARQAREPGWWRQYDDLGDIDLYIGLEQAAVGISHFGMYFIHGLLQTEDYARAILKAIQPKIDPKILAQRIEARMRRQELLEQPNLPRFRELLDEGALRRQVGGPAVMRAQLDRILQLVRENKVTVQVVPFDAGAHAIPDSNFTYLEFGDPSITNLIFSESLVSHLYHEQKAQLDRYHEALEYLRDAALSPRDSVNLIADIR